MKNFIVGYTIDEKGNKIIHSYGQNINNNFTTSLKKSGNYLESDFCEYIKDERLDYYINGKRMTDYEIFLKYGENTLPEGVKFNSNGCVVQKTDEEKMIDGEIQIKEGFEINNGKVTPIPYFRLKQAYAKGEDEFYDYLKNQILIAKNNNASNLLVKMDGGHYNMDESSIATLQKLVDLGIDIEWRDNDNKINKLTKEQAIRLIKTIEEKKQEILKKYWETKDHIKSMINSKKTFEEIIEYVETYINKSLDDASLYANEPNFFDELNAIEVPEVSPYSGLLPEEEIKTLRTQKGHKKVKP